MFRWYACSVRTSIGNLSKIFQPNTLPASMNVSISIPSLSLLFSIEFTHSLLLTYIWLCDVLLLAHSLRTHALFPLVHFFTLVLQKSASKRREKTVGKNPTAKTITELGLSNLTNTFFSFLLFFHVVRIFFIHQMLFYQIDGVSLRCYLSSSIFFILFFFVSSFCVFHFCFFFLFIFNHM